MEHGKHFMMKQIFIFLSLCVCTCVCLPVSKWKIQWIAYSEIRKDTMQEMEKRDRNGIVFPLKPLADESDSDPSYAVLIPEQYQSHSPFTSHGDTTSPGHQSDSKQSSDGKHLLSIESNTGANYSLVQGVTKNTSLLKVLTHRYNNTVQKAGTGGIYTFNDQINFAELKSEPKPLTEQSSEMVVVSIATAVAALFSLSVMAALFGCCCRKKRQIKKSDSRDSLKESSESGASPSTVNVKQEPSTDRDNNAVRKDSKPKIKENGDGDDPVLSVKDKIKAFETQKKNIHVSQPPESPRQLKQRPLSEAFKHFETTGILIGMGKSPKKAAEVRGDTPEPEEEEIPGINHNHIPAITEVSPAPSGAIYSSEEDDDIPKIDNPDVVIASEDDDDEDEFAAIERETEVLKSFRRAAPPRNRNPATRASRQKLKDELRPQKRDSPAKETSSLDSKPVENRLTPDKLTKENKKTDVSKTASPDSNSQYRLTAAAGPSIEENRTSKSASGSVENVFYLIDPTAKSKSVGDVQKLPSVDKVKKLHKDRNVKDSEELIQALRSKMQKDDKNYSTEQKQDDDLSATERKRTQSDPSRQSQTFVQTNV
ncbi:hypothetical protein ACJMK2_033312 [Sinanodonta woodiana]|uniref:Uncharacterized protein n=1 Tax=Sinanodonta woodiana TaxID=1069815 RepID=A0ABD3WPC7_SINWO